MPRPPDALQDWELRIKEFDDRLQPIAGRPVDITRRGWLEKLQANMPPLDEAGIRSGAETLLSEVIEAYGAGSDETRAAIRELFVKYRSFAWAAAPVAPLVNPGALRRRLILFSMKDQGSDSRDALVTLDEICREARAAGLDLAGVLREVAAMSSSANRFGMGSTREMLLKRCDARSK